MVTTFVSGMEGKGSFDIGCVMRAGVGVHATMLFSMRSRMGGWYNAGGVEGVDARGPENCGKLSIRWCHCVQSSQPFGASTKWKQLFKMMQTLLWGLFLSE